MDRLCRLHDAMERNDEKHFRMVLDENLSAQIQVDPRHLAGLMVLAAEVGLIGFVEAILAHNDHASQKLSTTHIIAVLNIIEQSRAISNELLKYKDRLVN